VPDEDLAKRMAVAELGIVALGKIATNQNKEIKDLTKRMADVQTSLRDAGSVQS
jgi:hypothetical protein